MAQAFSCEFWEISGKNAFSAEHLWAAASEQCQGIKWNWAWQGNFNISILVIFDLCSGTRYWVLPQPIF